MSMAPLNMKKILLTALGVICTSALAQVQTPEDLNRRMVERRAVEAVIWGLPAVNLDLMVQAMIASAKGKPNQIVYWSRLPTGRTRRSRPIPT
jgi:hypothetical protein